MNQQTKYNLLTHSIFSHNHILSVLDSMKLQYSYLLVENEESYSRFEVISSVEDFNKVRDITEQNNGTAITIQYGAY